MAKGIFTQRQLNRTRYLGDSSLNTSAPFVEYMIVAGGATGGGVNSGATGGGGAGGVLAGLTYVTPGITYPVTVGAGGAAGAMYNPDSGSLDYANAPQSTFANLIAVGGGYARGSNYQAASGQFRQQAGSSPGGSGGGGRIAISTYRTGEPGGQGIPGQGFPGGAGSPRGNSPYPMGGGGGAGSAGGNGSFCSSPTNEAAGHGGAGVSSWIGGQRRQVGGGGGGWGRGLPFPGGSNQGAWGGWGGGGHSGNFSNDSPLQRQTGGDANTGGGAGDANDIGPFPAVNGGSGIIIIRHPSVFKDAVGLTGGTKSYANSHTIYTFTSSGSITF
jgi:hypothetical protein